MRTITFGVTSRDAELLDIMCKQDGDTSGSALIRKLIRDEAGRREIILEVQEEEEELQPA